MKQYVVKDVKTVIIKIKMAVNPAKKNATNVLILKLVFNARNLIIYSKTNVLKTVNLVITN